MSDDEADQELVELLRKSLFTNENKASLAVRTRVLEGAEHVYDNSIDVALDMHGTKSAARNVANSMREKGYDIKAWSKHELHPKVKDKNTVNFIFTMDLLNFCFWSENINSDERFAIEYRGKLWKGYWSLVAALQRALEEGRSAIKVTNCVESDPYGRKTYR